MKRTGMCAALLIIISLLATAVTGCAGITAQAVPTPVPASPASVPDRIEPTPVDNFSNIFIGNLHSAHTLYSDGSLRYPGEFYATFKPYWDWIATTDHVCLISPEEWLSIVDNANANNSNTFVSLIGYEWTSSVWGHLSIVHAGEPLPDSTKLAASINPSYDTPGELYAFLNSHQGIAVFAHPTHPAYHIDFSRDSFYRNDATASLVCLFGFRDSIHWNATWDYADGRSIPVPNAETAYPGGWIKPALDRGYHLGFVGALDQHEKGINPLSYRYTGVITDKLTRKNVFEALKNRHTYAVRSPGGLGMKILLRVDSGEHLMGDIFNQESNLLNVRVRGKTDLAGFTQINLFVNGIITQSRKVSGQELSESFNITLNKTDNYLFFEVKAVNDAGLVSQAFSSPMYVTVSGVK